MPHTVEIENIEEIRRQQGIDDVDLRVEMRALKAGDMVKLTLLAAAGSFETLLVRITSVRGSAFRGKLVKRPTLSGLSKLGAGFPVVFTTAHVHSLLRNHDGEGD
jgi:hypothetical protein